jgi:hypothetical protein
MAKSKVIGKVVKLPAVRLSFPDLYEAKAFQEGQEPKYGATFLLDPKNPKHAAAIKEIDAECQRIITETWGAAPKGMKPIDCHGNGNDCVSQQTGEPYTGYVGMYFVRGKSSKQPLLIDKDRNELANSDPRIYGGVYVNATINFYAQDNKYGKGVRCSVRAVMTLGYGDPFGSVVTDSEFDDFDAEGDDL